METLPGVDKTVAFPDFLKLSRHASEEFDPASYALPE